MMTFESQSVEAEAQANYQAFRAALPYLLQGYTGKYAVFRNRQLVGVYNTFSDALVQCRNLFENKRYSIHEITERQELAWRRR